MNARDHGYVQPHGAHRAPELADRSRGADRAAPAAGRGWADVVAFLLEHGANPSLKDAAARRSTSRRRRCGRPIPNAERIAELLKSATGKP